MSSSNTNTNTTKRSAPCTVAELEEASRSNANEKLPNEGTHDSDFSAPCTLVDMPKKVHRKKVYKWTAPSNSDNLSDQIVPHDDQVGTPWGYLFCQVNRSDRRYNFPTTDSLEENEYKVMHSLGKWQAEYEESRKNWSSQSQERGQHLQAWLSTNAKKALDDHILLINGRPKRESFCKDTYSGRNSQQLQALAHNQLLYLQDHTAGASMSPSHPSGHSPGSSETSIPKAQPAPSAGTSQSAQQTAQQTHRTVQAQQDQSSRTSPGTHFSLINADRRAPGSTQPVARKSLPYPIEQAALYQLWQNLNDPDKQASLSSELWADARRELERQVEELRAQMSSHMTLPRSALSDLGPSGPSPGKPPDLDGRKSLRTAMNKITKGLPTSSSTHLQAPYANGLPDVMPSPFKELQYESLFGSLGVSLTFSTARVMWSPPASGM